MKKTIILSVLLSSLMYATDSSTSSIPNVIITDNPNREVTTVTTKRNRERAELNLNIKKVTSSAVDTYVTKSKKLISFVLDNINQEDKFYLTSDREIFNNRTKRLKVVENEFELKNMDLDNKVVSFKYNTLPTTLYLVKYNDKTKDLLKLYKWQNSGEVKYLNEVRGKIVYSFTDKYKPFEIVDFSRSDRSLLAKGVIEIKEGENLKINPEGAKEVILKTLNGDILEKITLNKGTGYAKLDDTKKGIILQDGSSILNFGIGFDNGRPNLQIKGTTDASKEYPLLVEVVNMDDTVSEYSLGIKPAEYGFKVLNTGLDLDFSNAISTLEANSEQETKDLIATGVITLDSKGLDIKANFINNGLVKLKNGEVEIDAKLDSVLLKNSGDNKMIQVIGKIDKEKIKNVPGGEYTGTTELVISIDS